MSEAELPLQYLRGIELFNARKYFDCHEAFEEIWLPAKGMEREFLHAIIQAAVALYHHQRGNHKGAASVYRRARLKLDNLPGVMMRLDTRSFASDLDSFFATAFDTDGPKSPPPELRLLKS